jgi:hypothetical protein
VPGDSVRACLIRRAREVTPPGILVVGSMSAGLSMSQRAVGLSTVALIVACTAYVALPIFLQPHFCPSGTFGAGATASVIWLVVGAVILMSFFLGLMLRLGRGTAVSHLDKVDPPRPVRSRREWIIPSLISVFVLVTTITVWTSFLGSYFCLTGNGILIHTSLFGPSKVLPWSRVEKVGAKCGPTKGARLRRQERFDRFGWSCS